MMSHAQCATTPRSAGPPPALMATSTAALRKAEARIADLEVHLATLEGLLADTAIIPEPWGLTQTERLMFSALVHRSVCHADSLLGLLEYRKRKRLMSDRAVVRLHLRRLRKKLAPFGVIVRQKVFIGYWLDPEVRAEYQTAPTQRPPVIFTSQQDAGHSPETTSRPSALRLRPKIAHSDYSRRFHGAGRQLQSQPAGPT